MQHVSDILIKVMVILAGPSDVHRMIGQIRGHPKQRGGAAGLSFTDSNRQQC